MVERNIFGNTRSPYLPLFDWAGCELGDLKEMVRRQGLEPTLDSLREAGVYVRFEEFKGREPIVRGGRELAVSPSDFDNPFLAASYQVSTSGSTGRATRVSIDLDHLADTSMLAPICAAVHSVLGAPGALWSPILPSPTGMSSVLVSAKGRQPLERWFTPVSRRDLRRSLKSWLATEYILSVGGRAGVRLARPEPVEPAQAVTVARWANDSVRRKGKASLSTSVSLALRVAAAARDAGIDLNGAVVWGSGEPSTPAKVREIEAAGARFVSTYGTAEAGGIGIGCPNPEGANDNHVLKHQIAIVRSPRRVPGFDISVDAFLLTGLLGSSAKVVLNVESNDYGVIGKRDCGCLFQELGFDEHVSDIFSFSKLTGEGVTLVGSDMVRILEEDLPRRFGGGPHHYQLLEEEDERGLTRVSIVVSPRVTIADETSVIAEFLEALRRSDRDMESALFKRSDTLRVRRMEPLETGRGKVSPLHAKLDRGS
jgi:hypothetical protein